METKEINEIEKQKDLTIVLNGGGLEMQGATIPVKWFFSKDLVLSEPKYIVLVDLTEDELKRGDHANYLGRRYLVKVEEAVKYLQVFKSGNHTMIALAFENKERASLFMEHHSDNNDMYARMIRWEDILDGSVDNKDYSHSKNFSASTAVNFTVPKELFAKKPETKLGKMWFNYIFWPKKPKPTDECQVRKLSWFYSIPKLIPLTLTNLFYFLYIPIAVLILLYFGYQSINFREVLSRMFKPLKYLRDLDVFVAGASETKPRKIYVDGFPSGKKTWFSPFHLSMFIASVAATYLLFANIDSNSNFLLITMVSMLFVFLSLYLILKRFWDEDDVLSISCFLFMLYVLVVSIVNISMKEELVLSFPNLFIAIALIVICIIVVIAIFSQELNDLFSNLYAKVFKKEKKDDDYRDYLLKNFTKLEEEVHLDNLPKTYKSNKMKRDLTVRFWTTKSNVCRPYES